MDADHPGTVFVRKFAGDEETAVKVLKTSAKPSQVPLSIPTDCRLQPNGLDLSQQWYIHDHLSSLCSSSLAASFTCPKPKQHL